MQQNLHSKTSALNSIYILFF